MIDKELHDCFSRYVQSLNLPCVTNTLNARNYVESDREELKKEEEDDKSISLGMPMQPQEEDEEEQVEEEWSSYPSPTPNNGNPMNTPSNNIDDDPLCDFSLFNLWEDCDDIKEIDDTMSSLDDLSLCGDSTENYVVKFTFDACNYYKRGRNKSPLYTSMLLKMQATDYYMHWIPHICCYLFIYKMPMHRKMVRLKSQWFQVLWCAPYAFT